MKSLPSSPALLLCLGISALLVACGGGSSSGSGGWGGGNNNPPPTVSSISPTTVAAGSPDLTLTVNGTGFLTTTVIQLGSAVEATTYVSSTKVTAIVTASQLQNGANLSVIALNGTSTRGSGPAINLQVTNPSPAITATTPAAVAVGTTSTVVSVAGTGFVPSTVINVNGSARTTTFTSSTQVNVVLTAADVTTGGNLSLTAVNPAPGGGTSAVQPLAVNYPVARVTSISPSTVLTTATAPVTVTLTGTNFFAASTIQTNTSLGSVAVARATTFVSSTQLTFQLAAADLAQQQQFLISVVNPTPGGGTSLFAVLNVLPPTPTPVITQVSPNTLIAGSGATSITVYGSNLFPNSALSGSPTSTVNWNGTPLSMLGWGWSGAPTNQYLGAVVPASLLASAGSATITVTDPAATPSTSNAVTVTIENPPPPTLTQISPSAGPVNTPAALKLYGAGFTASSTVAVNGGNVAATYVSSTELDMTLPASTIALPGNVSISVTTLAPGGGTTSPLVFTAYVAIPNNDMVYNPTDGWLYLSVPTSAPGITGNSIVALDPVTGNVKRQIFAGSNPNKVALSSDGKQIFVGLDGAASVAQIDLPSGKVVSKFSLGGGPGVYNPPYTAISLAAVPGMPNSVAVASNGSVFGGNGVAIYDAGVMRNKTSIALGVTGGALSFGSSASTLYVAGSGVERLTVDATGITATAQLSTTGFYGNSNIQYDAGSLYLSNGVVLDATTGAQLGTFYASASTPATGPNVSDSTLGLSFIAYGGGFSTSPAILAFDEKTFDPTGTIPMGTMNANGSTGGFLRLVRWGQNGLAANNGAQIYLFQSPVVKDLSPSPADVSVTLTAPDSAATGNAISYVATVKNLGPNQALSAALGLGLDSSLIINSITPSQGSCAAGNSFSCDLGNMASGASATVTVSATPTTAGTLAGSAVVSSTSYDPALTNNQATSSTTVTGSLYGAVPAVTAISPTLVQAGSPAFTLTVNGLGFNASSTVNLNGSGLATTFVSATQLTAQVTDTDIANYGWAAITVTNPSPGGGSSQVVPLTIYGVVNVPANGLVFDPFSQLLYASVPSAATTLTGNSVVSIDPVTGTIGTPLAVGSEPNVMTETTDGNYLFVGLSGANSLAKVDLLQQKVAATIPLSITQYGSTSNVAATWLSVMPGTDTTLAIDTGNIGGGVGIFDITGSTGAFRPNLTSVYTGNFPTFADPTHVYAYDNYTSGAEFYRFSVDANGLTEIDGSTLNGLGGPFQLSNSLVYGANGGIINPSTTPPSQIATMATPDFYQAGISTSGVAVVPDYSIRRDFLMLENTAGTWEYALARFDIATFLPEAWLTMPVANSAVLSNWTMLRWGQDGLALLSAVNSSVGSGSTTQILLIRGPFVTPQLLETSTPAALTSSSAATIAHGAGNTVLTLTGTNFLPGMAVTWNGSYRTTTVVDTTHTTVAIPASDLATAGSGSLVATNPGAPASKALAVTIN